MPAHEANPIYLSEGERRDLEALIRQKTCAQHVLAGVARIACARNCGTCAPPGSTRSPAVSVTRRCPCRRRAQCAAAERAAIPLQRHLDSCVISSSVGRSPRLNLPSPGFRPGFFGFAFFLPLEKGTACRLEERSFSSRRRLSAAISAASRAFCSHSSMTGAISVLDAQL